MLVTKTKQTKQTKPMKLNCDLGESFGAWKMGMDQEVIPHIDMANIACGFHAGDPDVMARTLEQTGECGTEIGAHPSYPDRAGFGRRVMDVDHQSLVNLLHYQLAALDGMAKLHNQQLSYVKPHGALFNQMMKQKAIRATVMHAVASFHRPLKLMLLASLDATTHLQEAQGYGIALLFEAFADRRYTDDGQLQNRNTAGAVLNQQQILTQVEQLVSQGQVTTASGKLLDIQADTLCVHGDNNEAVQLIKQIKKLCQS
jgi:UPF0271 protein